MLMPFVWRWQASRSTAVNYLQSLHRDAEQSQSTEMGKRDFIGKPVDLWPVAETAKLIGCWAPAFWPPSYGLLGDEDAALLWV